MKSMFDFPFKYCVFQVRLCHSLRPESAAVGRPVAILGKHKLCANTNTFRDIARNVFETMNQEAKEKLQITEQQLEQEIYRYILGPSQQFWESE